MIEEYLADSAGLVTELEGAAAAADVARARSAAHRLKSTALLVGAMDLAAVCADLEIVSDGSRAEASSIRRAVAQASKRFQATKGALRREISRMRRQQSR